MRVDVVVGMQYGSEAKGKICQHLAVNNEYSASMRVQSIQAGHTVYYKDKIFKMRTIPCAWVNPEILLLIGPGAFISTTLLYDEILMLEDIGINIRDRLFIDYRANFIIESDAKAEAKDELVGRIGSTGEGAGASLIRKLNRKETPTRVVDLADLLYDTRVSVCDTIRLMNSMDSILVEGCQGTMLSVHTSPHYPYVTSREATVSGILSECGISPRDVERVHGVFRTFPIRVGGNSGPVGSKELSWEEMAVISGITGLKPETTTVTGRDRRIFWYSPSEMHHAMMVNRPTHLYCMFLDYLSTYNTDVTNFSGLAADTKVWIKDREKELGAKIDYMSTGPKPEEHIYRLTDNVKCYDMYEPL